MFFSSRLCRVRILLMVVIAVSVTGCGEPAEDPETLAARAQYLVTAEPAGAISLTDAAAMVGVGTEKKEEPVVNEVPDVTVVGRIHAGQLEPWEAGKASFMLSEVPDEGHGEGHDSDNCPFCKRRLAKAPTAIVKFVDAQQQTLPIDSRKLFGLEKDQTVVVHGTVVAGEFNSIVLLADRLHIRKR